MSKNAPRTPSVSARRQEAERRRQEVRRRLIIAFSVAAGLIVIAVAAYVLSQEEDEPGAFTQMTGDRPLAAVDPEVRNGFYSEIPDMTIDTEKEYEALIRMADGGEMRLSLFDDESPITVNNFVFLANQGFFDGTTFHRVLENFMAQGGDPTGTGTGGPGYTIPDETDNGLTFDRRGLLAMANTGAPNSGSSQFFITFGPQESLNGGYTIFGELTEGDDVLSGITLRDPETDVAPGDTIEEVIIYER
jgi:peptidylprolyl isomerase